MDARDRVATAPGHHPRGADPGGVRPPAGVAGAARSKACWRCATAWRRCREEVRALRGRAGRAAAPPPAVAAAAARAADDAPYVAFENRFRGARDEIRERLVDYVRAVRGAGAGRRPRLRPRRVPGAAARGGHRGARGREATRTPSGECRARGPRRGRRATCSTSCARSRDGALGGVFAAQVAEHLPPPVLQAMLREAHRALRPGRPARPGDGEPALGARASSRSTSATSPTSGRCTRTRCASWPPPRASPTCASRCARRWTPPTRLQPVPGRGPAAAAADALNENVARLNALLYGAAGVRAHRAAVSVRLAFVSPLPPAPTGIADYAADVLARSWPAATRSTSSTTRTRSTPAACPPACAVHPRAAARGAPPGAALRPGRLPDGQRRRARVPLRRCWRGCPGLLVLHDLVLHHSRARDVPRLAGGRAPTPRTRRARRCATRRARPLDAYAAEVGVRLSRRRPSGWRAAQLGTVGDLLPYAYPLFRLPVEASRAGRRAQRRSWRTRSRGGAGRGVSAGRRCRSRRVPVAPERVRALRARLGIARRTSCVVGASAC